MDTKLQEKDPEALSKEIKLIVDMIHSDKDPAELESLRKLIRNNVPLLRRGYFMAYLFRDYLKNNGNAPAAKAKFIREKAAKEVKVREPREPREPKEVKSEKQAEKPQAERPQTEVPSFPADAKTLYLNIGKIRRLYVKDLTEFLMEALSIKKEDIYQIRIHDKYSFITMSEENCKKAIETISGTEIKGRVAQLSYSNRELTQNN